MKGQSIRPQEAGLLAALGKSQVPVYRKPVIGIISTGDEVVPISEIPARGQIRDINTYTLSGLIHEPEQRPSHTESFAMILISCLKNAGSHLSNVI